MLQRSILTVAALDVRAYYSHPTPNAHLQRPSGDGSGEVDFISLYCVAHFSTRR